MLAPGDTTLLDDDDGGATILDDGLSTCDREQPPYQITSAQAAAQRADANNYKCVSLFLLFATFVISFTVAASRSYRDLEVQQGAGAGGWNFGAWADRHRKEENARRLQRALDYLTHYAVSDVAALEPRSDASLFGVVTPNSPQYQAALWIAQFDAYRIAIPSTPAGGERAWEEERQFMQRYSLAVLFFATGGPEFWLWKMNFLSGRHECNWKDRFRVNRGQVDVYFGVICDGKPDFEEGEKDIWNGLRTVTGISLPPMNQLLGTLPPEVQHLSHLKAIHIENNKGLMGTIPFQYGSLKHMSVMALMDNSVSGKIPREFGRLKKMRYMRLERNQLNADTLVGDLDFMEDMESLSFITLDYNPGITGTLPNFFSKLPNIEVLSLSNLGMYGKLPASLSKLIKLKALYLDDNRFEGNLDVLQNLNTLSHVYLENNLFSGYISDAFLMNAKDLVHLDISNCSFWGTIPRHFFKLNSLEVLDMSRNNLVGELRSEAMSNATTNLNFLSLHTNNIAGTIPTSIRKLKSLSTLDLSNNLFSGDLPAEIAELANLDILFLGKNNFNDSPVPNWIRAMPKLVELSLKSSSLSGTIPDWLGELNRLHFLDLGENNLQGTIPQSLANLKYLMVLILNGNRLEGQLGLGQLAKLETLLIDDNELTGNTDAMCAHELIHFIADCPHTTLDARFNCTCCTLCCSRENTTCNDDEWLGNHEAMWEYGYNRMYWEFEDNGIISPYIDYNAHQR